MSTEPAAATAAKRQKPRPQARGRQARGAESRIHQTRAATARVTADDYTPVTRLRVPKARPGMHLRWVRELLPNGQRDTENLHRRKAEGYVPVTAGAYPDFAMGESGDDPIRRGAMMLMEIPKAKAQARQLYYERTARLQQDSVDILQGITTSGRQLPVTNESGPAEILVGGRRSGGPPI